MKINLKLAAIAFKNLSRSKTITAAKMGGIALCASVILIAIGFTGGYSEVFGEYRATVLAISRSLIAMAVITSAAIAFISAFVRTRDIGIVRAMGAGRFDAFMLIWLETFFLFAAGGLIGGLVSATGVYLAGVFTDCCSTYLLSGGAITADPVFLAIVIGGTVLLGLSGAAYPAVRAAKMKPIEAMRSREKYDG